VAIYSLETNQPDGWLNTTTPCSWPNITCIDNRHVTSLNLSNNQLSSIPPSINNLTELTVLELHNNLLSNIPSSIGNLTSLRELSLFNNKLSSLPADIGNLTNLTRLSLSSNGLSNLPTSFTNLITLNNLDVSNNRLAITDAELRAFLDEKDPDWVASQSFTCTNVIEMPHTECEALVAIYALITNISESQLNAILSCAESRIICNDGHITSLDLTGNDLSDLPPEIGNFTNLTYLYLSENKLTELAPEISKLTNLAEFFISKNKLVSLPDEIGNLINLKALYLDSNELVRLPASLTKLTNLYKNTGLDVRNNALDNLSSDLEAFLDEKAFGWSNSQRRTPTITPTPSNTSTHTPMPPTSTFTPSPTHTPVPSDTPTYTPTPSNTPTHTPTPTPAPADEYESDNECAGATSIGTDAQAQAHTFHTIADIDWATFTAATEGTYRVEVYVPSDSRADIDLAYFDVCESGSQEEWNQTFAPGVSLDIQAEADQQFYLKLYHVDSTIFGLDVNYELSVRRLPSEQPTGAVIILAGRGNGGDAGQDNINSAGTQFYELMQGKGVAREDILFLTTDSTIAGHNKEATAFNLNDGITQWAQERVSDQRALTLYLVGHGTQDLFYIDELKDESVSSDELSIWLSLLEQAVSDVEINVIIEASNSGSFIDQADGTISSPGRLIITSTDIDSDAYISRIGDEIVFSDALISRLWEGDHLAQAFRRSREYARTIFDYQTAWLDGNGNGIPDEEEDVAVAATRTFDFSSESITNKWPPYIARIQPLSQIMDGISILIEVRDDADVEAVWAVVYPPNYTPDDDPDDDPDDELAPISLSSMPPI